MNYSDNNILRAIRERRSVRRYSGKAVSDEALTLILEAARWTPSGLNNQPWRFSVIRERPVLESMAGLTKYGPIIIRADLCLALFLHQPSVYNRDKDLMALGACAQNILLAVHSLDLGAVWLGEILNRKNEVSTLLKTDAENELWAVIAIGHPDEIGSSSRKPLDELII